MNNTPDDASSESGTDNDDELTFKRVLGFNTAAGWSEYVSMASNYLQLSRTGTLRLIVLETWLFLDYTVRQILMAGLSIPRVDCDVLDLREELLPSFRQCLYLILRIRDMNLEFEKPVPRVTIPVDLFFHLEKNEPILLKQLIETENRFLASIGIPAENLCETSASPVLRTKISKPRWVSDEWLEMTSTIDKKWKTRAESLDRARNKAAHSYEELALAAPLGFTGPQALELAKAECRAMAKELVDVSEDSTWIEKWNGIQLGRNH